MRILFISYLLTAVLWTVPCPAEDSRPPAPATKAGPELYALGPDDEIIVQGLHIEELGNKPVRIDNNGDVNLPMVGRIHAGGLTVRAIEDELRRALSQWIKDPQITVSIVAMRS